MGFLGKKDVEVDHKGTENSAIRGVLEKGFKYKKLCVFGAEGEQSWGFLDVEILEIDGEHLRFSYVGASTGNVKNAVFDLSKISGCSFI